MAVDNASVAYRANENDCRHVRTFVRLRRREPVKGDGAVLLLAHAPMNARAAGRESDSGSTAWYNSARARLSLVRDGDVLTLSTDNLNFGRLPPPLVLRVNDHAVPLPDAARLPTAPVPLDANVLDANVLDAIRRAAACGQPIRTARMGAHPAGKVLHALLGELHKRAAIEATLDLLLASGKVVVQEVTTSARHRREVLLSAPNGPNAQQGYTGDSAQAFGASPPAAEAPQPPAAPAASNPPLDDDDVEVF